MLYARNYHEADSKLGKMKNLFLIRSILATKSMEIVLQADKQLVTFEEDVTASEMVAMRLCGYNFYGDLENWPELLNGEEEK